MQGCLGRILGKSEISLANHRGIKQACKKRELQSHQETGGFAKVVAEWLQNEFVLFQEAKGGEESKQKFYLRGKFLANEQM